MACPGLHFQHYPIKCMIFEGGGIIEHKMCVRIYLKSLSELFLILRRSERDITINVHTSLCKLPIILLRF
jgi:hypothetical protein